MNTTDRPAGRSSSRRPAPDRFRSRRLCPRFEILAAAAFALAAPAALGGPPIQQWQTASGTRVYFVESRNLPILDLSVEFPAGSSRDAPATSGLAGLTLRMLRFGAQGLTEEQISLRS